MSFENLELTKAECFGWKTLSGDFPGWVDVARQLRDIGWGSGSEQAVAELRKDLAADVVKSYRDICRFTVKDLDTDVVWDLAFVNDKQLWSLTLRGDARPLPEDLDGFFRSELFGQIARSASDRLRRAADVYDELVDERVEDGLLLDVDEVKLSAIMYWLRSKEFIENLLKGKHMT